MKRCDYVEAKITYLLSRLKKIGYHNSYHACCMRSTHAIVGVLKRKAPSWAFS